MVHDEIVSMIVDKEPQFWQRKYYIISCIIDVNFFSHWSFLSGLAKWITRDPFSFLVQLWYNKAVISQDSTFKNSCFTYLEKTISWCKTSYSLLKPKVNTNMPSSVNTGFKLILPFHYISQTFPSLLYFHPLIYYLPKKL